MTNPEYPLQTGGGRGYLRIATEEAFCPPPLMRRFLQVLEDKSIDDPGFYSLWGFYGGESERARLLRERIQDLDELRIRDMDATGIDRQIISITCPGVQMFPAEEAVGMAQDANDALSEAVKKHPDRFAGLRPLHRRRRTRLLRKFSAARRSLDSRASSLIRTRKIVISTIRISRQFWRRRKPAARRSISIPIRHRNN